MSTEVAASVDREEVEDGSSNATDKLWGAEEKAVQRLLP